MKYSICFLAREEIVRNLKYQNVVVIFYCGNAYTDCFSTRYQTWVTFFRRCSEWLSFFTAMELFYWFLQFVLVPFIFFPSGKWILLLPTDEVEADSQVEVYFLLKSNIFLIKFVFFLDWYQRLVYLSNLTVFSMNSTGSDCYPLSPDVNYWISTTLTGSIVLFLVFHTIPSVTWYVIIDQRGSVSLCVIQPVAQFKLKLKVSTISATVE